MSEPARSAEERGRLWTKKPDGLLPRTFRFLSRTPTSSLPRSSSLNWSYHSAGIKTTPSGHPDVFIYLFIYNLMFRIFFLGRKKKLITSLKEGNRKSQHYDADAGQARQPGTVSYLITV